jgi:hypothetical protein
MDHAAAHFHPGWIAIENEAPCSMPQGLHKCGVGAEFFLGCVEARGELSFEAFDCFEDFTR